MRLHLYQPGPSGDRRWGRNIHLSFRQSPSAPIGLDVGPAGLDAISTLVLFSLTKWPWPDHTCGQWELLWLCCRTDPDPAVHCPYVTTGCPYVTAWPGTSKQISQRWFVMFANFCGVNAPATASVSYVHDLTGSWTGKKSAPPFFPNDLPDSTSWLQQATGSIPFLAPPVNMGWGTKASELTSLISVF